MTESGPVDAAVKRLALALDALDAAVERRRDADRGARDLASQVHSFGADRSRLAAALDGETARVRSLEQMNRDIAQRIDAAIGSIRAVIEESEQA